MERERERGRERESTRRRERERKPQADSVLHTDPEIMTQTKPRVGCLTE